MAEHAGNLPSGAEETFFRSIRRVPPGCALSVRGSTRRIYRHWDPATATPGDDWLRSDPRELFEARLEQALERILRRGQAGIFLSGGIDSVSVAAIASDYTRRRGVEPPWALSLDFQHPEVDERATQRAVASALGMPQLLAKFEEALEGQRMVEGALALSSKMPVPLANPWLPGHRYLAVQGRERGCKVHITGGGGDDWMGVSPSWAADLIRAGRITWLWRLWRVQHRSYRISLLGSLKEIAWSFGARELLVDVRRAMLERVAPGVLHWRWRRRARHQLEPWIAPDPALRRDLEERAMERMSAPRPKNHYDGDSRLGLEHPLVSIEMEESFANAREIGVPSLQPFLDADIVELLYRLPPESHFSSGRGKGLARAMLAERFPELEFAKQRKVVSIPFVQMSFSEEGPKLWASLNSAEALANLDVVDRRLLENKVEGMLASPKQRRYLFRLWDLMSLEAWLRSRA
jgi:asparagine synthetase B (glutamine-hydrolysing)